MQSNITKEKLRIVVSMLENKNTDKKKLKLEEAKLNLLLNDPLPNFSTELSLINRGNIKQALISIIDKNFIIPTLRKFL
ncbi:hypothetical protein [Campylobacter concisus]|uniref:hypothetical protein n=1 Tax=Campylobacter concisus TaxID=199 RepID=UPI00015C495D|nr:hypothetical protein [Campylobacter concisus]